MTLPRSKSRVMASWLLQEQMESGVISFEAEYQRVCRWSDVKMSYLIDSIFKNYYIPPILFSTQLLNGRKIRMVIDGKQRLTAINRFMNNKYGYTDPEDNEQTLYFSRRPEDDDGLLYLSETQVEKFNSFQFVCVEYDGLTVDQEYYLFSRVQLGVAITNAEKLRAHNTPVAKVCKDLVEKFQGVRELVHKRDNSELFQIVLHMLLALRYEVTNFHGKFSDLREFVKLQEEVPFEDAEVVSRTLRDLMIISTTSQLRESFNKSASPPNLKSIEAVLFMLFQKAVQKPRSITLYATDFIELRKHLKIRDMRMGKATFLYGMQFIENRLEVENLVPIATAHDLNDETEEYHESLSRSESPPVVIITARRGGRSRTPSRRGGRPRNPSRR